MVEAIPEHGTNETLMNFHSNRNEFESDIPNYNRNRSQSDTEIPKASAVTDVERAVGESRYPNLIWILIAITVAGMAMLFGDWGLSLLVAETEQFGHVVDPSSFADNMLEASVGLEQDLTVSPKDYDIPQPAMQIHDDYFASWIYPDTNVTVSNSSVRDMSM